MKTEEIQEHISEQERNRMALIAYEMEFCEKFGGKNKDHGYSIKVRAANKCRDIIKHLELKPTDDDFCTGKVFTSKRDGYVFKSAFISTKQGGLIACIFIRLPGWDEDHVPYDMHRWIDSKVYDHHKTAEMIAAEEDFKRRKEEAEVKHAEWEKQNSAERAAEREELKAQVKQTALPDALVDELIILAVKETDHQRENSPDRRPTFAPPIPFSPELVDALEQSKALYPKREFEPVEPGYGRLWAVWESPKKAHGKCKGFELRAGKAHDGWIIAEARPGWGGKSGKWFTGPSPVVPGLYLESWMGSDQVEVQKKAYNKRKEHFLASSQLRELGIAEILKFAGAPGEMTAAMEHLKRKRTDALRCPRCRHLVRQSPLEGEYRDQYLCSCSIVYAGLALRPESEMQYLRLIESSFSKRR
jgi:hypothetical protein